MSDPSLAVQGAIYAALNGKISVASAASVGVYDKVPAGAAFPYVTLDSEFVVDADFLNSRMDERFFYLNVWSTYSGQRQVKEIMAAIDTLLHQKRLPLAVGSMVICRVIRKRTEREPDGETFQGQVTLRILTQH